MRRNLIVIIGIAVASLVLAACSSAPQATHMNLHQKQTKADKALFSIPKRTNFAPYQPKYPAAVWGYRINNTAYWDTVPGIKPNAPNVKKLKSLLSNTSWKYNFAASTVITGKNAGEIIVESCVQGVPVGIWPEQLTYFQPGPTQVHAILKGTPVTTEQYKPGTFWPIIFQYQFIYGRWQQVGINPGVFSCENNGEPGGNNQPICLSGCVSKQSVPACFFAPQGQIEIGPAQIPIDGWIATCTSACKQAGGTISCSWPSGPCGTTQGSAPAYKNGALIQCASPLKITTGVPNSGGYGYTG